MAVDGVRAGRTILPVTAQGDFAVYTLEFFPAGSGQPAVTAERTNANLSDPVNIEAGTWDLRVTAFMDAGKARPAAHGGLAEIAIAPGESVTRAVELAAVISGGEGTFSWKINYPENIVNAVMTIVPLDGEGGPGTLYFDGGTPVIGREDSLVLNAGYYRVIIKLKNNRSQSASLRHILHVYQNMESALEFAFTDSHLTALVVTSGADSGPDTLRAAITGAPDNSTVVIDESVGAITLSGSLDIDKNIAVAGNGVTVTGARMNIGSDATVTISRMRFAGGGGNGGVHNAGTLALESCIFSMNNTDGSGGAVNNQASLAVAGCTFYGNSASSGGAIYNSGVLNLEGNLFCGNTGEYPVVHSDGDTASLGYNIADVPLGTGSDNSGWAPADTDNTFAGLNISGMPFDTETFAPVSVLGDVIITPSAEFPGTDFYGNTRTFPGMPGAAAFPADTVTVTFNPDNGLPAFQRAALRGGKLAEPAAAREGYAFGGWHATGSAVWNFDTDTVTSDTVLHAQWTPVNYTVTYNANSATGGAVPADSANYNIGNTVTVLGNTGALVRTGYTFAGWNTASNGTGTSYTTGATFTMGSANVILYAQWTPVNYTVTYNANNATGGTAPTDSTNYNIGNTVTVLGNTGSLVRTGYTFTGWNTASNGTGTSYTASTTFNMGSANVTLYAQWTLTNYTVTYNANNATGGVVPTDSTNYNIDNTVTVLGNTGSLIRTGYTFAGWNTASNGTGTNYTAGATFNMGSANVTLYAQWTPVNYTVTYNANSATGGVVPTDSENYNIGNTVTVLGNTGSLVRTGYTFAGWNTASDGTGTSYTTGATFSMGSANVTLYARWTPINYTVTYNANNATGGAIPTDSANYNIGNTVTVLGNTGSLARTGYTFAGWNTASNGTDTSYTAGATFSMGSANVTLYAQWTPVNYTVTYNANSATGGTVPTDSTNYNIGNTVTVLGNTGSLVRTGYTFAGWNTASGGTGTSYTTGATFSMGSANVTLYARWVNTVTYNANGATSGTVPTDSANYNIGNTVTVLGNTGSLARTGYTFAGWNTASNGTGTNYTASATFNMGSANVTLYARWIEPIEMVQLNAGTFTMGSPTTEANRGDNETQHQVTLTKGFYMGKYEVTQEQYQAVMGTNPSSFSSNPASGEVQARRPVENVSWYDAVEFCNALSVLEGLAPAYTITERSPASGYPIKGASVTANWGASGYRLPTEAEWEYACRAGTTTAYNTGETISYDTGWYNSNSGSRTHEVGKKPPNAWGLYDMHGNVSEWCWDWYSYDYESGAQTDPVGVSSGSHRVHRGGSWYNYYSAETVRSACRGSGSPSGQFNFHGFRVLRP